MLSLPSDIDVCSRTLLMPNSLSNPNRGSPAILHRYHCKTWPGCSSPCVWVAISPFSVVDMDPGEREGLPWVQGNPGRADFPLHTLGKGEVAHPSQRGGAPDGQVGYHPVPR